MYAFKHVYEVEDQRPPTVHELWGKVLGDVFVWMHSQLYDEKSVTWGGLLTEWENRWGEAGKALGADLTELTRARNRGARHVRELFDSIQPDMGVLGVQYPCWRSIGGFTIHGHVPVIRIFEQKDKGKSGRQLEIVTLDTMATRTPTEFEASRDFLFILHKYGLEPELRKSFRKIAKDISSVVYLPRVPKLASFKITELAGRQALRWIAWVLEGIELGHFYPRVGGHCTFCFYQPVCDIRFVSNRKLEDPETPENIRSKLCQNSK